MAQGKRSEVDDGEDLVLLKCLVPECQKMPVGRGLCANHYALAKRLIKAKKTTWERLVKSGKAIKLKSEKNAEVEAWFLNENKS